MRRSRLATALAAACLGMGLVAVPVQQQAAGATTQTTLWDNNSAGAVTQTYANGNILCCSNSQDQSGSYPNYSDQTADDFSVPENQQWSVSQVDVSGSVYAPFSTYPSSFNVYIYADGGGHPGTVISAQTGIAPSNSSSSSPTLPLTPVSLSGGRYWVSVQAVGSFFRWYWDDTTPPTGSTYPAQFQEPNGGDFGSSNPCATWTARTTCIGDGTHVDQTFSILGTYIANLSQVGSTASSSGTEGQTPTAPGYYLGTFQNSSCTTQQAASSDYYGNVYWAGAGAGSTTATISATSTPCQFNVYGSYAYFAEGTYRPAVTVTDLSTGAYITLYAYLNIGEAALTFATAPANGGCTLFASCTFNAAGFTDGNPYCNSEVAGTQQNPTVQYSATVNFGDGTSASSTSTNNGAVQITENNSTCSFNVTATHTYSSTGPFTVTTTVCDNDGASVNNCVTTSTTAHTAPVVTVGTPPSTVASGRLSYFTINYQHYTPYPNYSNYTVGFTEYHYNTSGSNIANLNYIDTFDQIGLSYCATQNKATTQCRARVLSFTCTATTATVYMEYQLPGQSTYHYVEISGDSATNTFSITTDNGAGMVTTTTPPATVPPGAVRVHC